MTLPYEEYWALINARNFLLSLLDPKETPRVPGHIRKIARDRLKHYPAAYKIREKWQMIAIMLCFVTCAHGQLLPFLDSNGCRIVTYNHGYASPRPGSASGYRWVSRVVVLRGPKELEAFYKCPGGRVPVNGWGDSPNEAYNSLLEGISGREIDLDGVYVPIPDVGAVFAGLGAEVRCQTRKKALDKQAHFYAVASVCHLSDGQMARVGQCIQVAVNKELTDEGYAENSEAVPNAVRALRDLDAEIEHLSLDSLDIDADLAGMGYGLLKSWFVPER